jgi:hypothetical protein
MNDEFFNRLPARHDFSDLTVLGSYQPLPEDWLVCIADVANSTGAIKAGRYKDVNLLGAATIAAVVNALRPLEIPYSFGGDGAVISVPGSARAAAGSALAAARRLAAERFGLVLRIGVVPVGDIRAAGYEVLAARFQPSEGLYQAFFLGGGTQWADNCLREPVRGAAYRRMAEQAIPKGDFSGLECRWSHFSSPRGECLSLLAAAVEPGAPASARTFASILEQTEAIYGESTPNPVDAGALQLTWSPWDLRSEARVRATGGRGSQAAYMAKVWVLNRVGAYFMRRGTVTGQTEWGRYKTDFVRNSDYRKCDDLLRVILPGTPAQHDRLEAYLEGRYAKGQLVYGCHRAPQLITTCLVDSYQQMHQHFIDTALGGYARAAEGLKKRIAERAGKATAG